MIQAVSLPQQRVHNGKQPGVCENVPEQIAVRRLPVEHASHVHSCARSAEHTAGFRIPQRFCGTCNRKCKGKTGAVEWGVRTRAESVLVKRDGGVGGGDFVLGKDPTKDKKAVEIKHVEEDRVRG